MRLLVTGASGFLGRNMLLALPRSWQVVALYRPGNSTFLEFVNNAQLTHVQPAACDLTNIQQVQKVVEDYGGEFDSCLALASNTFIPFSIEQPAQDLITNTLSMLNVLQSYVFDHLVYLSSGAVYIGLTGLVGPSSAVSPTLPYAISKLASEQYVRASALHRQSPKRATLVRFFGAYGPYEPARKLYTKLVHRFAFERNPHFTVIGDGENFIDAMYVDDAVQALLTVLDAPSEIGIRCVDLGVGRGESVNQVVTRAAHAFGLEPHIEHVRTSAEYIQFFIDPQLFAQAYNFTPTTLLEEGLKRLAAHLGHEDMQRSL